MNYISEFYRSRARWHYGVGVLAVAIALLLKLLLIPLIDRESPFLLFFAAVLVSDYFFLSPTYSFINYNEGQNLRLVLFMLEGIAIKLVVAAQKATNRRAELSKLEALHHQETLREQELRTAVAVGRADDERWHIRSNGTRFWASGVVTALRDKAGSLRGLSRVVRDITDRKWAEEALRASEERLRLALEVARMSTWDWNILTNQVTWSHNYERLFGLTPGSFGKTYEAVLEYVHPQDRQLLVEAVTCCLEKKVCYDHEYRIIWPDGSIRWMAGKGEVFYDETGTTPVRMIGITTDITQRKQTAEQLKASLREKEVLLKEIHHRVKNNMQVICSLLNLQSASISDPQTLELLQEGQNRVASMALVHERLYQSEDLAKIDFAEYIQNLAANLFSSYDVHSNALDLKINVDKVFLSVDAAIPCGLIINELVANSLKYAFPPGKSGEIRIDMHLDNDNQLTLSVSDNGIGFPPDLDFRDTESLGLQLVTALTSQLEGTIDLNINMGTEFKITFQDKSKVTGM